MIGPALLGATALPQDALIAVKRTLPLTLILLSLAALALPASARAALSSFSATSDATNLAPTLKYTGSYEFYRVYLDTIDQRSTGLAVGGIRANYLVENGELYRYTGSGTSWSWAFVRNVGYTNSAGTARWTISRSTIGESETSNATDMVFEVEAPLITSARYTYGYGSPPPPSPPPPPPVVNQKVAIPAYFGPGSKWTQLQDAAPTVGLAIINPDNGPGAKYSASYYNTTHAAQQKGVKVLGYVYSTYIDRPIAQVKADIDRYYNWYAVDGIFIDEASTDCKERPYYEELHRYIKARHGMVVINPGTLTPKCYIEVADIIVNFEDDYSKYGAWKPMGWESEFPACRFWHLVINTTQANMPKAIALSKTRNAGWVYVTPDKLDNPWDTLPTGTYWADELTRVKKN
jgi:hypothetical protein